MRNARTMLTVLVLMLCRSQSADATELLRDPTRPQTVNSVMPRRTATFKVTAIFMSSKRRVAVVNGHQVLEGEEIDGATVIEILAHSLRLNIHGRKVTSRLLPVGLAP